jgi:hypothetical protein
MGLPGALLAVVTETLILAIWPAPELLPRDTAWPFFLLVSALWGACVPLAWLATRRLSGWRRALGFLALMALGGVATALAVYGIFIRPIA